MSGHPALSVPAGLCANGIPFGLQVAGPRWRDDLVLDFGGAWEEVHPWPATAPGYEPFAVP
jgi:amidase/aspartyl-tRNA(Asn)/glutamyl-tRNA(Gln) amidotransferase subunit A